MLFRHAKIFLIYFTIITLMCNFNIIFISFDLLCSMQLPDELLKQLRLLTDKPISSKVNKQLYSLLLHENLPLIKSIQLLNLKFRSDLIIYLLQNNRYPTEQAINSMLVSIQNNILQYKINQVVQIYILILTKIDDDNKLLDLSYYQLIKLAIKLPNLQTKEKLFQLIQNNAEYLYKRKCKKVIMAIIRNYLDVFSKFLIYVPSYLSVIQLILQIDRESKKIINKPNPQKQPLIQQIFIDLQSQQLSAIKNVILTILQNTKDKANYYALHRNCLNALKCIADTLNQFKLKQSALQFTQLDVGQICKVIQFFIDRKGTIDQARFAKSVWLKRFQELKRIKQLKTEKYVNPSNVPSLILEKNSNEKPLFIEQVISRTNNYRLKYQVSPQQNQLQPSRIISVSNNFLKKGVGIGGGRTYLLNQKQKQANAQQRTRNRNLYEQVVNKCFDQSKEQIEFKSYVDDPKFVREQQSFKIQSQLQPNYSRQNKNIQQAHMQSIKWNEIPAFSKQQIESVSRYENTRHLNQSMKQSRLTSSMIEDDEDVLQINNLIDLAYSFKFS